MEARIVAKKEKEMKETPVEETPEPVVENAEAPEVPEVNPWEEKYKAEHDSHLRLAAEYDNFRKRTVREKREAVGLGTAAALEAVLPAFDTLKLAAMAPCAFSCPAVTGSLS